MFTISMSSGRGGHSDLTSALVLALGTFAVGADAFAIAGFLPSMADALHVSAADGGQSVTVFVVAYAILAPVLAVTTAHVPRRVLLIGSLLVLGVANLGSALAPDLATMIASRVLAAAGAAAYTPIAVAVCATLVRPGHRGRALAMVVGGMAAAAVLAMSLGGVADRLFGWRTAVGTLSLMCFVACLGVVRTMPVLPYIPFGAVAGVFRRPGLPAALSITVVGMAAGFTVYAYSVLALSDVVVPEIVAVLTLFLYGVGAVLLNTMTGMREAREERLRIARDLHDSLTHSISVIKTQTGIAVYLAHKRGEQVPDALLAIQEASTEAMRELRATLQVLRDPDGEPAGGGLDGLPGLVDRARSAGLATALTISGERRDLPADVDHTAYRIVQEALTNVSRHAGEASALVQISHRPDALTVRVDDDGAATPDTIPEPGIGLTGMRERVTALGGRLEAGPRPGGGFSVLAEIPVSGRPADFRRAARAVVTRIGSSVSPAVRS
jgi:signal transduction histidine kinase